MVIRVLFLLACCLSAYCNTYFVSTSGNDGNSGSISSPWATIQRACNTLQPGDSVIIRDGVYYTDKIIRPRNSGTKDKWITYYVLPNERVVIDGDSVKYLDEEAKKDTKLRERVARRGKDINSVSISSFTIGIFHIEKVNYIRVVGLEVQHSHDAGFIVKGPSKCVELINCKTDETFNSGIGVWYADSVKVLYCEITRANNEKKAFQYTVRYEAPHEALSLAGAKYFEVAYNNVHLSFKEGIDCKEVSAFGRIHHNHVHNMLRQGLYIDCWFGLLHDIEAHDNYIHHCDIAGIAISGEGEQASMENIKIYHNLVIDNKGSGILFGTWGKDRLRKNIEIYNNTIYNNGQPGHWTGENGGIDIRSENIKNLKIHHNVIYQNWGFEIGLTQKNAKTDSLLRANQISVYDNVLGEFKSKFTDRIVSHFPHVFGYQSPTCKVLENPFLDVIKKDFRLKENNHLYGAQNFGIGFDTNYR